jgi:hypothetical protein
MPDPDRIDPAAASVGADPAVVAFDRPDPPHDFDSVASIDAVVPEAPVVIIRERRTSAWWPLLPPLILASVAMILVANRTVRPRQAPSGTYVVVAPPEIRPAPTPVAVAPLAMEMKVIPSAEPEVDPSPADRISPEWIDRPIPDATGLVLPGKVVAVPTTPPPPAPPVLEPEPLPNTSDAVALIKKEASRRRLEREQAEALMARQPAIERDRIEQQADDLALLRRRYRAALQDALNRLGDRAGPEILRLTETSAKQPSAEVEKAIAADLARSRGRLLNRAGRIALFRSHGLSEPLILAELERDLMKRHLERGGPRNRAEALVRAARQLLAVPPPSDDDVRLTATVRGTPHAAQ